VLDAPVQKGVNEEVGGELRSQHVVTKLRLGVGGKSGGGTQNWDLYTFVVVGGEGRSSRVFHERDGRLSNQQTLMVRSIYRGRSVGENITEPIPPKSSKGEPKTNRF